MYQTRRRKSALWTGAVLMLLAVLSNVLFFIKAPAQHAIPWLNLLLSVAAVVVLALGIKRAFSQPDVYSGKVSGSVLTGIAVLLLAVTVFGFYSARHLPSNAEAPRVGQRAPEFTLADSTGKTVTLAQLITEPIQTSVGARPTKAALLVFYRGYW